MNAFLKRLGIISVLAFISLLWGCKSFLVDKNFSEGQIEYDITYPKMKKNDIYQSMYPQKMILKFKNNITMTELTSGMGIMSTSFISNSNMHTLSHLMKMVNNRYVLQMDSIEVSQGYGKLPDDMKISYSNETKEILGYKCKKASVTFGDGNKGFDVFYTNEIAIKEPNWAIPFHAIDGVLMEYQMKNYNIEMSLKASSVKKTEINDKDFEISPDYKKVSQDEMKEIIQGF